MDGQANGQTDQWRAQSRPFEIRFKARLGEHRADVGATGEIPSLTGVPYGRSAQDYGKSRCVIWESDAVDPTTAGSTA